MSDTTRTVLIALGVTLLVVVLLPLLLMTGMMGAVMGGGMRGGIWAMGGLVVLLLVSAIALLAVAPRGRQ